MEMLSIDIIGLAGACSYALDCIEAELVNIKNKHGKRVAYISICMAEYWEIQGDELQDLAMCALLHDNALTQYISEELKKDSVIDLKKDLSEEKTNLHCIYGEKNITKLPFKTDVSNVILYHHEHADGTGSFQKKWNEIPLFARIIHLADIIDIIRNSIDSDDNSWDLWGTVTIGSKGQIVIPKAAREAFEHEKQKQEDLGLHCEVTIDGYTDFIFINRFGQAQHQATLNKAIRRIIRDCNDEQFLHSDEPDVLLPHFSCHSLRHTFTTRMCEAGVNIKVIQDALGHSDISTTLNIYADVTKEMKAEEFKGLDSYFKV